MHQIDPYSYFRPEVSALEAAPTIQSLLPIALRILERMPHGVSMVCGPISTGGKGSVEENLALFGVAIETLASRGENIFSQMPFERPIQRMKKTNSGLLNTFYLPIFKSGRVRRLCFLPGWESSEGATWEHERGVELGFEIKEFRPDFHLIEKKESLFKLHSGVFAQ